jgi:hypothetical protein
MLAFFITILIASFVGFWILFQLSYVKTPQYKSKIIAGFGGEFKRATEAGLSWKTLIPQSDRILFASFPLPHSRWFGLPPKHRLANGKN